MPQSTMTLAMETTEPQWRCIPQYLSSNCSRESTQPTDSERTTSLIGSQVVSLVSQASIAAKRGAFVVFGVIVNDEGSQRKEALSFL